MEGPKMNNAIRYNLRLHMIPSGIIEISSVPKYTYKLLSQRAGVITFRAISSNYEIDARKISSIEATQVFANTIMNPWEYPGQRVNYG